MSDNSEYPYVVGKNLFPTLHVYGATKEFLDGLTGTRFKIKNTGLFMWEITLEDGRVLLAKSDE